MRRLFTCVFVSLLACPLWAADISTNLIPQKMTSPTAARLQTLDVLGLGLSIEHFRQSDVLTKMDETGDKSIIPQDQKFYYFDASYRGLITNQREADALEHCLSYFVAGWVIPNVYTAPKRRYQPERATEQLAYDMVADLKQSAGLHGHQTKMLKRVFSDLPENILESAFQFFEYYPEVPVLLLFVQDGNNSGDGYHKAGDPTDSSVAILLARRERIEEMRPYVRPTTGPNAYKEVPHPGKPAFKPSQFLPKSWLDWQIKQFDALPTIGILHRPVVVSYMKDKDGKPTPDPQSKKSLMNDHEKQLAFQAAWKSVTAELPPEQKPARIFYDHGDASHGKALVPLSLALHLQDPGFDLFNPKQGYNQFRRLGETGAASPFVMWGTGLIATFRKNNPSVTVNLRDPNQATITLITAPTGPRKHPAGDAIDFGLATTFGDQPEAPVALASTATEP